MKKTLLLLIIISLISLSFIKNNNKDSTLYIVYKIDSISNFYLIYLKNDISCIKVISIKDTIPSKCKPIKIGEKNFFELKSVLWGEQKIGDTVITIVPNHAVKCISLNKDIKVCRENDTIVDLCVTKNLNGLCYQE